MTASALATQQGTAMTLQRSGPTGRHHKTSNTAAGWTTAEHRRPVTARSAGRHRKAPHAATRKATARHRKSPQAATITTTPRHRKKGCGDHQFVYAEFSATQGNSIRVAPRRVAVPSAIAVGMLAVGGAITGAFNVPMPDADRANASDHGDVASATVPPSPLLTAKATPSPTVNPRASRGTREPLVAADSAAWPISDQAATNDGSGNAAAGEPAKAITNATAHDRGPEIRVFTPPTPPDPPSGHGGGGPAEPSTPQTPPAGGDTLFGLLRPIGQLVGLPAERNEDNGNGAADEVDTPSPDGGTPTDGATPTGDGTGGREPKSPNVIRNDSGSDAENHTSRGTRAERRSEARGADDGDGSGRSSVPRKSDNTSGADSGGRDRQSAGGGHHRRGGDDQ